MLIQKYEINDLELQYNFSIQFIRCIFPYQFEFFYETNGLEGSGDCFYLNTFPCCFMICSLHKEYFKSRLNYLSVMINK